MTSHEERLQQAALVSLDLYTAVPWWKHRALLRQIYEMSGT